MMNEADSWPTEIRLNKDKTTLLVNFSNGTNFSYTAEFLRVLSPSAEVQGHSPEQRQTVPGKQNVRMTAIEPVGNYAIRIRFDDGHDTGLYSWPYLYNLGRSYDDHWQDYLTELSKKGLSRA